MQRQTKARKLCLLPESGDVPMESLSHYLWGQCRWNDTSYWAQPSFWASNTSDILCQCHRCTEGKPGTVLPLRGFQSSGGDKTPRREMKEETPSLWRGTTCCGASKEGDYDGLRVQGRFQEENTSEMVFEAQEEFQEEETGEYQGKGRGQYGFKDSGCFGWTQVSRTPSPRTPSVT